MNKNRLVLLFFMLLGAVCTVAREYKVEEVPMVHLQDKTRYVSNPDNILSSSVVATMDSLLFSLEQSTGIQVVVVAVTDIAGGDCFDFAYRLGKENGVGQEGRDNGLVVLLSTGERCVQFATGYGLEGVMPDAICKRIQQKYMVGHFANDDWNSGMLEGIRAVCGHLDGSMENVADDENELLPILLFLFILFSGTMFAFWASWYYNRCPQCKKHNILRVDSKILQRCNGYVVRETTYKCQDCGHTFTRRSNSDDFGNRGSRGGGVIIMGGGFGRSGGGFGGGSFGGGSFGGGGAGSRF
jgi:uncharacterized protein